MKAFIYLTLSLCIALISCNTSSQQQTGQLSKLADSLNTTSHTTVNIPKTFYKKLQGTIGDNLSVTMDLTKTDSIQITGAYFYHKIGLPLALNGELSPSGDITLHERNEKYEETGLFTGHFTSPETIEGTWTNPRTHKSLPFKLTESKAGVALISFESYYKENCDAKEKNKAKFSDDMSWTDTLCSYISIGLVKVTTGDASVSKTINTKIIRAVCDNGEKQYNSIIGYLNSINQLEDLNYLSVDKDVSVTTNDHNVLCLSINESQYSGGAAHPNHAGFYYNFNLATGQTIQLSDILNAGYKNKLNRLAEKIFVSSYGREDWDFEPQKFELNDNFAITAGGLLFSFNPYEIGPYAAGDPEVFIPYKDIRDLIKPNSVLEPFIQ